MTAGSSKLTLAVATALGSLVVANAYAVPQPYTDLATFEADLAAAGLDSVLHDFVDAAVGTTLSGNTVDGIGFSAFTGGVTDGIITDAQDGFYRSNPKAIGTNLGGTNDQFEDGDGYTFSFSPANAVGIWFITASPPNTPPFNGPIRADSFSLTVSGVTQGNAASPEETYGGGAPFGTDGYFIGFIDPISTFSSATVSSLLDSHGDFEFVNDDIYTAAQAPLPSTAALIAIGALALGSRLLGSRRRFEHA